MTPIELSISLELSSACNPEVRAWLDLAPNQGLGTEVEVGLQADAHGAWRAVIEVDERACEPIAYRIGVVAHPEATWSLRIRERSAECDLLFDSDALPSTKAWLLGNFSLGQAAKAAEVAPDRGPERPCHLVLIPGGGKAHPRTARPQLALMARS